MFVALLLLLLALALLVLAAHESGHLAAGALVGFKCHLFVVGPLRLRRVRGRLKAGWNRSLWMAGGAVWMLPSDGRNLMSRVAWMVAGGPLASLALSLAGFAAHAALRGTKGTQIFWFLGICSAAIFAATAVPSRLGHYSDGARLIQLWRGGPAAQRWCAQVALFGMSAEAVRPNAWDPKWIPTVIQSADVFEDVRLSIMAYEWYLDRSEIEAARRWLNTAIENVDRLPKSIHSSVAAEAAYFHALYGGRERELRVWLERARSDDSPAANYSRLRAEAAVARAEGNTEEAFKAIAEARVALDAAPRTGMVSAEYDWLQRIAEGIRGQGA